MFVSFQFIASALHKLMRLACTVISHYYHFAAECLYGLWRSYSSLLPESITAYGDAKKLGMPKRVIFSRTGSHEWQDYSGMNDLIVRFFTYFKKEAQGAYQQPCFFFR